MFKSINLPGLLVQFFILLAEFCGKYNFSVGVAFIILLEQFCDNLSVGVAQ